MKQFITDINGSQVEVTNLEEGISQCKDAIIWLSEENPFPDALKGWKHTLVELFKLKNEPLPLELFILIKHALSYAEYFILHDIKPYLTDTENILIYCGYVIEVYGNNKYQVLSDTMHPFFDSLSEAEEWLYTNVYLNNYDS